MILTAYDLALLRKPRTKWREKIEFNESEFAQEYVDGAGVPVLMKKYGVSHKQASEILSRNGVQIRSRSEAAIFRHKGK